MVRCKDRKGVFICKILAQSFASAFIFFMFVEVEECDMCGSYVSQSSMVVMKMQCMCITCSTAHISSVLRSTLS